jgi:hypothetical protein
MRPATTTHFLSRTLAAVVGSLWLVGSAIPAVATPAHLLWAEDVVEHIAPADNAYGSSPTYLTWAGVNGATSYTNRTECSSFVTRVLKQAYGWTNADFTAWFNSTSPTAAKYHDAIVAGNQFVAFTQVNDIQSGDFLAVKYLDGTTTSTGHMMIATGPATLRMATAPHVSGTTQYEVEVIDSSKSGHGPTDTRLQEDGTWQDGVGMGILRLYADTTGAIVGYSWSTYSSSVYYDQATRHLVIGRLP